MDCKQYQSWLNDEALGGISSTRSAELRSHLAACADCRAGLERRRVFLGTMDQAVSEASASEPSGAFAACVRERIAEHPAPAANWFAGWVPWAAGAAVAVTIVLVFVLVAGESPSPANPRGATTKQAAPAPAVAELTPAQPRAGDSTRRAARSIRRARPAPQTNPAAVEVIIPREEIEGIAWLARQLQQKPVQTTTLLADLRARTERQTEPLRLEDRVIAPLEIPPVEKLTGSERSSTEGKEQE